MLWLTWRQYRRPALGWAIGLALLAAVLLVTGLGMRDTFDRLGLAACSRADGGHVVLLLDAPGCADGLQQFTDRYSLYEFAALLLVALPLVLGLFWGPTLVADETEPGTHRLVWTQGVGRRHWALVRFGLVGSAVTATAIGFALLVSWWFEPLHRTGSNRFGDLSFDVQGVASVGYTVFAVALGLLGGTLLRRNGPAMTLTLVGFLAVRIAVAQWARPHYLPPGLLTSPYSEQIDRVVAPDDWTVATQIRDAAGRVLHSNGHVSCAPDTPCWDYGKGAYNWVLWQPASRFWTFQWIETGVFTALAAVLVVVALRRLRRVA